MDETGPARRSATTPVGEADDPGTAAAKAALRREILRRRRVRDDATRARDDAARAWAVRAWLAGLPRLATVACYLSGATEPGTAALVSWLWRQGARVVVPTLAHDGDGRPAWAVLAEADGLRLVRGVPTPVAPRPCPEGLAAADAILVPGLAGTPRGDRLGRGGGWYDRALAARRAAPVCLLLNTDEILPALPVTAHDQPVHWLATPDGVRATEAGRSLAPTA